ncbi:MAG TPA: adenosylcobalamin-dependent ribonucleoside-diphosphate reductase, partial [Candidatus Eisenbacteria bacterium]
TPNAKVVVEHRYLLKDETGRLLETPEEMFARVARSIAEADRAHEGVAEARDLEERYYQAMADLLFLPNSPTLMNAGTSLGQFAACFVLPVEDSLDSIFTSVRNAAVIHQSGGGTGFSFSHLRPQGDRVRESGGVASGPVSFIRVFDTATEVIKQGGRRRGANMAVLSVSHPDVLDFIHAKHDPTRFLNFNFSVSAPDTFLEAVEGDRVWPLVNPRTGAPVREVRARELWQEIAASAWRTGDPGVLFADAIERGNPTPELGRLEATNPCGEQPLLPYEACTLGSINLARLVDSGTFDRQRLDELARLGVRFLDNVIEASRYPLPEIERAVRGNRKIGLGVMGVAEALIRLGIPYASQEAADWIEQVLERMARVAREASVALAERRGAFPNCPRSVWPKRGVPEIRNATLITVAPTGTLAIVAGTSSGVEPLFGLAYLRRALDGVELREVNPLFLSELERRRLPAESIVQRVLRSGSVLGVPELPEELRRLFATAYDVAPEWHVRIQAAAQRHADNGVSKTVNLPRNATPDDVRGVYELAWRLGCKGVTVFRDGCRGTQVLELGSIPAFGVEESGARATAEYAGECRDCSI